MEHNVISIFKTERTEAFETWCYRQMLKRLVGLKITNEEIYERANEKQIFRY